MHADTRDCFQALDVVGVALVWPARQPCVAAGACYVPDLDGQPALALCLRGVDAVAAWSKEAAAVRCTVACGMLALTALCRMPHPLLWHGACWLATV